jgi:Cytotoxic translational repressor of toxin-antitoxin stability system
VTSYDVQLHTRASDELSKLPTDTRERLTDTLVDVAGTRQPATHTRVKHMDGDFNLMRVRAGDYRAVIALRQPDLLVLRVGKRDKIFREKSDLGNRLDA